jgi:hypothetical protein
MPLRLRRGLDTERQNVIFAEAELVYITDEKEIWVGDGSTVGGLRVTGVVPTSINDLDDINLSTNAPQIGQTLVWDGEFFIPADIFDGSVESYSIGIEGNVYGQDSSIIVNYLTNTVTADIVTNNINSLSGDLEIGTDTGVGSIIIGNYVSPTILDSTSIVIRNTSIPSTSVGSAGDVHGLFAIDSGYIYYCTADYDGVTDIWNRVPLSTGPWS